MASGPDLFVVCKTCGSEVSPYITECPYCGSRLRKRAPKIEPDGTISEPAPPRRRSHVRIPRAMRSPRRGAMPPRAFFPTRVHPPYVTIALVALSCAMWVARAWISLGDVVVLTSIADEPARLFSSVLAYPDGWYQAVTLLTVAVFGWRMELRHGPLVVLGLFLLGGVGGLAVAIEAGDAPVMGANGAALALLCAWAMRDALAAREHRPYDGDLLGTAAISAVVFLMPAVVDGASWVAGGVGIAVGALAGLALARRG